MFQSIIFFFLKKYSFTRSGLAGGSLVKFTCMLWCVVQVQKKGKETYQAQKQLKMDLAAIEAVCQVDSFDL